MICLESEVRMSEEKCIFKTSHPYFKKGAESCRIHTQPCSDIAFMCHKNCTFYKLNKENKRLREAIDDIKFEAEFNGNDESVQKMFMIAKQALGE